MFVSISLSFLFFGRLHQRQLSTTSSSFSSDAIIAIQQWKWNGAGGGGGAYYCQKAPTATTKSQTAGSYYRRHHSQYVVLMFRWLFCVHISTSTRIQFKVLNKFWYFKTPNIVCSQACIRNIIVYWNGKKNPSSEHNFFNYVPNMLLSWPFHTFEGSFFIFSWAKQINN